MRYNGDSTAVHSPDVFPAMLTMSTMFSSVIHRVNNTVVDNITNVPQVEAYLKRTTIGQSDRQGAGMVENFDNEKSRKDYASGQINNDMCWLPACLSLFNSAYFLPSNHSCS